jgi:hypothetical protein
MTLNKSTGERLLWINIKNKTSKTTINKYTTENRRKIKLNTTTSLLRKKASKKKRKCEAEE